MTQHATEAQSPALEGELNDRFPSDHIAEHHESGMMFSFDVTP
jgi:hypothetical protein